MATDPFWTPSDNQSSFVDQGNIYSDTGDLISYGDGQSSSGSNPFDEIYAAADKNNAWSAEQAAIQRDWQVEQNKKAMDFNSAQAQLNRNWQEEMSNSAHQREVKDLLAAGLNPVLSATGGNGASVGSGATASGVTSAGAKGDTDESTTGAITSYLASLLAAQTSILNTQTSAQASMASSSMMAAASQYAAQLSYEAQMSDPTRIAGGLVNELLESVGMTDSGSGISSAAYQAGKTVNNTVNNVKETYENVKNASSVKEAIQTVGSAIKNAISYKDYWPDIVNKVKSSKIYKAVGNWLAGK